MRRGRPVTVLAFLDSGDGDHPVVARLRAAGVPVTSVELPPRAYLAERRRLRAAAVAADVVHTHGARVDVVDLGPARRAGLGTVTTLHGFTGGGAKNRAYEWLQRRAVRHAHSVVAVSRPMAERLAARGLPAARLRVLPNAWAPEGDPLPRAAARAALGVAAEGLRLGWVGRLTREKGADVLVDAVGRLGGAEGAVSVIGDGAERAALAARAQAHGVASRFAWHGALAGAGRLMRAFDVFVLSSRTEGTPIVLLEAMAAGVPVVASAVGGVPDVVSPAEAWLVPPDDPEALSAALAEAARQPEERARRAAAAAARLARDFALEPWLDAYEEIYLDVARRAGRCP